MEKNLNKIENVCVFASSCDYIDKVYFDDAYMMGKLLAQNGFNVVYGGSNLGLMGEATNASRLNGADIIGVMPEKLYNLGIKEGDCTKFILTKGMRERKAKMDELSQAVVALAGGFGTLEELSEMIVQKQLGYNKKPIVLLNTNGFYTKLVEFFDEIIEKKFASKESREIYFVAKTPKEAIEYLKNYKENDLNYLDKKLHNGEKINL